MRVDLHPWCIRVRLKIEKLYLPCDSVWSNYPVSLHYDRIECRDIDIEWLREHCPKKPLRRKTQVASQIAQYALLHSHSWGGTFSTLTLSLPLILNMQKTLCAWGFQNQQFSFEIFFWNTWDINESWVICISCYNKQNSPAGIGFWMARQGSPGLAAANAFPHETCPHNPAQFWPHSHYIYTGYSTYDVNVAPVPFITVHVFYIFHVYIHLYHIYRCICMCVCSRVRMQLWKGYIVDMFLGTPFSTHPWWVRSFATT